MIRGDKIDEPLTERQLDRYEAYRQQSGIDADKTKERPHPDSGQRSVTVIFRRRQVHYTEVCRGGNRLRTAPNRAGNAAAEDICSL
jgi:hypothetical protein